jgi:sec-independent protein translocase protein TatA
MGWESPSRWLIIAVVVIVLFGYKKLPDAARSVGRSLRIFKTEIKGMADDDKSREQAAKSGTVDAKPATAAAGSTDNGAAPAVEPPVRTPGDGEADAPRAG